MADDILTFADSDATSKETDSQIAGEVKDVEDSADVSSDKTETQTVEADKTVKRVEDTQTALKEAQRELHSVKEALAELRGEQRALLAQRDANKEPEQDWVGRDESLYEGITMDALERDPAKVLSSHDAKLVTNIRGDIAKILDKRDEYFMQRMVDEISKATNPKLNEVREEIAELSKTVPNFGQLDKSTQIALAEIIKNRSASGKNAPGLQPPAGLRGGQRTQAPREDQSKKEAERIAREIFGDPGAAPSDGSVQVTIA